MDIDRTAHTLGFLSAEQRQLLSAALAGNHPTALAHLREPMIRALAKADVNVLSGHWPNHSAVTDS